MSENNAINPKKSAVSASYLKIIVDALALKGLDTSALLAKAGISDELFNAQDDFITVQQYERLIGEAIKQSRDPLLGLYVGKYFEVGTHGILSYAALGMPRVWECLKLGEKFSRIRSPILDIELSLETEEAVIAFDTKAFSGPVYQFVMEGVLCSYYAILNLVFEHKVPRAKILLKYPPPENAIEYEKRFGAQVFFGATENQISFPKQVVEKPLVTANPVIAKELEQTINLLLQGLENNSTTEKVKQLISSTIGIIPSQESVAEHLNISTRTLRRQLQTEGVSFQALLNEVRRDLAISHLENSEWGIEEIAYILGFSSSSHFSHAFKNWTGVAPKYFRERKN